MKRFLAITVVGMSIGFLAVHWSDASGFVGEASAQNLIAMNGHQTEPEQIALFSGWAEEGAYKALDRSAHFYMSSKLCPNHWYWSTRDNHAEIAQNWYLEKIEEDFDQIEKYINIECKMNMIFDESNKLYFSNKFIKENFVLRYTPVTIFVSQGNSRIYKRYGMLEYEFAKTGKQNVSIYNSNKTKICEGTMEYFLSEQGDFFLRCFNRQLEIRGLVELRNNVIGRKHAVGSGVTSHRNSFIFITGLTGTFLNDNYDQIENINEGKDLLEVLEISDETENVSDDVPFPKDSKE